MPKTATPPCRHATPPHSDAASNNVNHGAAQPPSNSLFLQSIPRNSAPTAQTGHVPEIVGHVRRNTQHPWLASPDVQGDLRNAVLQLTTAEEDQYDQDADYYQVEGDRFLETYCRERQLAHLRQLSSVDAKALAVALDKNFVLATDEWPLREFSQQVEGDVNGQLIPLMSSLDLLNLFVDDGRLSMEDLRKTVRGWVLADERLLYGWQRLYFNLFNEQPPTGQV